MVLNRPLTLDGLAFTAMAGFLATLYLSLGQWLPALEPLHIPLVLSVLALACVALRRAINGQPLWFGARGAALTGFASIALLSVGHAIDPEVSRAAAIDLAKLTLLFLVLVNVTNSPARLRIACMAMALAALVPAWGTVTAWRDGTALVDGFRARWLGVLADPNHDAMALVAVVPIALTIALNDASGGARRGLGRMLWLGATGLLVAAIVTTHSRGGALGLALACAAWATTQRRRIQSIAFVFVALLAVATFAPSSFWARNETIGDYETDASAQGRLHAWTVVGRILEERPLIGVGAGGFLTAWPRYAPLEAGTTRYVPHNVLLEVAAEEGLPALVLFLFALVASLRGAWRARRDQLTAALFSALAGYLLCDLTSGYSVSWYLVALCGLCTCAERVAARAPVALPARSLRPRLVEASGG